MLEAAGEIVMLTKWHRVLSSGGSDGNGISLGFLLPYTPSERR